MRLLRHVALPSRQAPGESLLSARGVHITLGDKHILRGVDVDVRAGEVVVLAGPNGAGKSTLFNILAGDIGADAGDVVVAGRPIAKWSRVELARQRAVLPQRVEMSFPFLVREVVAMGRAPWHGTPRCEDDDATVAAALRLSGLEEFAGQRFTSLSGGERARVAFARVYAQEAQCLLLDEPTAALDIRHQEELLATVRLLVDEGAGALVVLHDLALAAVHADRIVLMREGKVVADGPPGEVLTPALLGLAYDYAIDVVPHPETGDLLIVPVRRRPG